MSMVPLLLALSSAPLSAALSAAPEVVIAQPELHLGDVVRLSGGDAAERERVWGLTLARLPQGRRSMLLSRRAIADLLRRSTGLSVANVSTGSVSIRSERAAEGVGGARCWAAAADLQADAAVGPTDLVQAPCSTGAVHGALRFNRSSNLLRTTAPIAIGTPLGRMAPVAAGVEAGAAMTLSSRSGPVAVSRPVVALQAGREGRRIFVRDEDGAVLAVRVQPEQGGQP